MKQDKIIKSMTVLLLLHASDTQTNKNFVDKSRDKASLELNY